MCKSLPRWCTTYDLCGYSVEHLYSNRGDNNFASPLHLLTIRRVASSQTSDNHARGSLGRIALGRAVLYRAISVWLCPCLPVSTPRQFNTILPPTCDLLLGQRIHPSSRSKFLSFYS